MCTSGHDFAADTLAGFGKDDPSAVRRAPLLLRFAKLLPRPLLGRLQTTHVHQNGAHRVVSVASFSNPTIASSKKGFEPFGSLSDAVARAMGDANAVSSTETGPVLYFMWDANTGKSRGYGFLAFRDRTDAEQAINAMNGEWLGARAIRVNWANQKNNQGVPQPGGGPGMSSGGGPPPTSVSALSVEGAFSSRTVDFCWWQLDAVINQAPAHNTTVYVGNLVPYATQADLAPLFQSIGHVFEIRLQADRGFAFVKYATHELAASAIVNLNGTMVHGRPLKLSWGKESGREPAPGGYPQGGGHAPQPMAAGAPQDPVAAAAAMAAWQAQYGAQWAACKSGVFSPTFFFFRARDKLTCEICPWKQTFSNNRRCNRSRASVLLCPGNSSRSSNIIRFHSTRLLASSPACSPLESSAFFLPIRPRPLRPTSHLVPSRPDLVRPHTSCSSRFSLSPSMSPPS